jgi:hypothetical protein
VLVPSSVMMPGLAARTYAARSVTVTASVM